MCGRYVSVARVAELIEQYKATGPGDDKQLAPSYNVAPTNKVHAVLERDRPDGSGAVRGGGRGAVGSSAGVVETRHRPEVREGEDHADAAQRPVRQVATAPSWQGPFAKRRAVIHAAEYYEWLPAEDADGNPFRQPYYIHPADGMLSFAGLCELWPDPARDVDDPDPGCGRRRSSPTTPGPRGRRAVPGRRPVPRSSSRRDRESRASGPRMGIPPGPARAPAAEPCGACAADAGPAGPDNDPTGGRRKAKVAVITQGQLNAAYRRGVDAGRRRITLDDLRRAPS
jgi:putative SOS response-associated peptidase YedK